MKIAINCVYYSQQSGGLREYIYNLVDNLSKIDIKNSYIFYISKDQKEYWNKTLPYCQNIKLIPFTIDEKIKRSYLQNSFWKTEIESEKIDIFHSPFFHIPSSLNCKTIITFHDLRLKNYPDTYTLYRRLFLEYAIKNSLKKVNKIITVSNFTKYELIKYYGISESKIETILEGIDLKRFSLNKINFDKEKIFLSKNQLESKKFILSVGHIEPRKNYLRLIDAFIMLINKQKINMKLVIVGRKNYKYNQVIKRIKQYQKSIIHLDFVEENELLILYKNAKLLVFPSIYEGFGFPPLEAAAMGIPSIVSRSSSIPEICGKGALYFNPFKIDDIKEKISIILSNDRIYESIQLKSIENLKRFSWENNAQRTLNLYKKLYST